MIQDKLHVSDLMAVMGEKLMLLAAHDALLRELPFSCRGT